MGRFGLGLVRPGRCGLILVWVDSALKVSRLGSEWLRLWAGLVPFPLGAFENDGVWYTDRYKDRAGLWYK